MAGRWIETVAQFVNAVVFLDLKKAFDTVDHDICYENCNTTEFIDPVINGLLLI